jgi:hypothetical protein
VCHRLVRYLLKRNEVLLQSPPQKVVWCINVTGFIASINPLLRYELHVMPNEETKRAGNMKPYAYSEPLRQHGNDFVMRMSL